MPRIFIFHVRSQKKISRKIITQYYISFILARGQRDLTSIITGFIPITTQSSKKMLSWFASSHFLHHCRSKDIFSRTFPHVQALYYTINTSSPWSVNSDFRDAIMHNFHGWRIRSKLYKRVGKQKIVLLRCRLCYDRKFITLLIVFPFF